MEADPVDSAAAAARAAIELARSAADAVPADELALSTDTADQAKQRLQAAHSDLGRSLSTARESAATLKAAIDAKKAELDAMQRALAAELAPIQEQVARIQEGIAAVNLYLGRDEYIETLIDGAPADASEPIHVRQLVLAMDEETALIPELGGLDHRHLDRFFDWLRADPAHLDQVIPEPKCVVAFIPRRDPKEYSENPWENATKQAEDAVTWWLIRNGHALYLMTTDFQIGARITPRRDELAGLFAKRDWRGQPTGETMEPGSSEWLKAERSADARTRHYMKVALILQGLIDRTAVLAPLPAGGVNLLAQSTYDAGLARIIADDDLQIGTGRQPFKEWHRDRISQLQVGMRVIGHFPTWVGRDDTPVVTPRFARGELDNVAHTITRQDAHSWFFTFDRTDEVERRDPWGRISWGPAKTRATYQLAKRSWEPQWIPVDTVEIEEMERYLAARSERHAYRSMFPALQAAIAFKRAEDAEEKPFRDLLAAALTSAGHATDDTAETMARDLIRWFKTANKWHRALNGDPEHEALAQRKILAEAARRAGATVSDDVLAGIRALVPDALAIAHRSSDIIAVEEQPRRYPEKSAPRGVFVRIHEFTPTGTLRHTHEWKTLTRSQVARWTILEQSEAFAAWNLDAPRGLLTDADLDEAIAQLREHQWDEPGLTTRAIVHQDRLADGHTSRAVRTRLVSTTELASDAWRRGGRPRPVQRIAYVRIERTADGIRTTIEERPYSAEWSFDRDELIPWHEVNYSDEPGPGTTIFEDPAAVRADLAVVGPWADAERRDRDQSRKATDLYMTLESSWKAEEEAAAYERYIEDYADPTLWEDHKKSLRIAPYPPRTHAGSAISDALRGLALAAVRLGIGTDGITVAQAIQETGFTPKVDLPANILRLWFGK